MSDLKIKGRIISIDQKETGTSKAGKDWQKSGFVIETEGKYPKVLHLTAMGEIVGVVQSLQVAEDVEVYFEPQSREYNGRYYTECRAWKIERLGNQQASQQPQQQASEPPQSTATFIIGGQDDLPF